MQPILHTHYFLHSIWIMNFWMKMLGDWNNKILCWFDYENELLHARWKWPWFSENFRWDSDSKSPGYVFQNHKYNRSVSVLVKKNPKVEKESLKNWLILIYQNYHDNEEVKINWFLEFSKPTCYWKSSTTMDK